MCYPFRDWEKRNPHTTFRPWGKPLLSSAHLSAHLRDPIMTISCSYWCVHAVFNRAFDAKEKPCLGENVLEHLFLHSCSSLMPNLHLHCISIVQRHTVWICVIRSQFIWNTCVPWLLILSDFYDQLRGTFQHWVLVRLDKFNFVCDVALSLFKDVCVYIETSKTIPFQSLERRQDLEAIQSV